MFLFGSSHGLWHSWNTVFVSSSQIPLRQQLVEPSVFSLWRSFPAETPEYLRIAVQLSQHMSGLFSFEGGNEKRMWIWFKARRLFSFFLLNSISFSCLGPHSLEAILEIIIFLEDPSSPFSETAFRTTARRCCSQWLALAHRPLLPMFWTSVSLSGASWT